MRFLFPLVVFVSLPCVTLGDDVDDRLLASRLRIVLGYCSSNGKAIPRSIESLLDKEPLDVNKVEALLDPLCLAIVSINAESRVKAVRGAAKATLRGGQRCLFLVKVANGAGVTQALAISGSHIVEGSPRPGDWLQAEVIGIPKMRKGLTGAKLDYVVLALRADQVGKREATLKFDVGQGTQDLGFRAEVPILFKILPKESK